LYHSFVVVGSCPVLAVVGRCLVLEAPWLQLLIIKLEWQVVLLIVKFGSII